VYLAKRLGLQVGDTGVEETAYSQGAELTDVDLVELEATKGRNKKAAEGGPVEEPRRFITTKMATAFPEYPQKWQDILKVQKVIIIEPTLGYHIANRQSRYITSARLKSA